MAQSGSTTVSWKVGRYEVVGPLATGGMAEILLARIVGPSGFQRPVVIKRILPHLAREKEFVEMFLDEARIVAGIRHPNVVQVHELGHEADELFLVMEYLEGESAAGLGKRLRAHHEDLDFGLAAYIVAEACAGLHAAHELVDSNGNRQNVVHRDISPQNVFVTYDGQVKVLDFGIAVAADRVTRTETGTFKGKFEYASPEQCRGHKLDRRSDVFALGILLFEVSTGMRLFKRQGQLATLRAICEEPTIKPTELIEGYPPALEKILLRALAHDRDDRYATALEMRRDLLAAFRSISTELAPAEQLAGTMQRLFGDRVHEKSAMLRRVESGSIVDAIPAVETDISIELPLAVEADSTPPSSSNTAPSGPFAPHERDLLQPVLVEPTLLERGGIGGGGRGVGAKQRLVLASGAALLAVTVIGGVALFRSSRTTAAKPTPVASVSATTTEAIETSKAAANANATVTAVLPELVTVRIETAPPKAHVFIDGQDRGVSPLDLRLARSTKVQEIEIRRDGYVSQRESVAPETDQKIKLTLLPASSQTGPKPSANPYKRFD